MLLYGGGPVIEKIYPNFYTKKVILTVLHQTKMRFGYSNVRSIDYEKGCTF